MDVSDMFTVNDPTLDEILEEDDIDLLTAIPNQPRGLERFGKAMKTQGFLLMVSLYRPIKTLDPLSDTPLIQIFHELEDLHRNPRVPIVMAIHLDDGRIGEIRINAIADLLRYDLPTIFDRLGSGFRNYLNLHDRWWSH